MMDKVIAIGEAILSNLVEGDSFFEFLERKISTSTIDYSKVKLNSEFLCTLKEIAAKKISRNKKIVGVVMADFYEEGGRGMSGFFANLGVGILDPINILGAGVGGQVAKGVFKGSIELESSSATVLKDGITVVDKTTISSDEATITATAIDTSKVTSVTDAEDAIKKIDAALADVDGFRGDLGAIQARFESAVACLSSSVENLSAARSRVMDADFASETANMTKNQILQQAGVAMVSQANSAPQSVLSLLG